MPSKRTDRGGAAVDEASDDSFPASDPPSFTPISSLGPPPEDTEQVDPVDLGDRNWMALLLKIGAALAAAGAAAWLIYAGMQRRKNRRRRLNPRELSRMGGALGAAVAPAVAATKKRVPSQAIGALEMAGERLHPEEVARAARQGLRKVEERIDERLAA